MWRDSYRVVLLREGWFISTKGVACGQVEDRSGEHGGLGTNLLGRNWLGRFLYLGEPDESDERND